MYMNIDFTDAGFQAFATAEGAVKTRIKEIMSSKIAGHRGHYYTGNKYQSSLNKEAKNLLGISAPVFKWVGA